MKIKINEIITNERIRKDLGDIMELATDIEENGQISPIAITIDKVLIAGGRRLAACIKLGWTEIEAIVLEIREAEKLVHLEMAENIARKDLTFSEKMSYAQKLEAIESEKARLRQEHRSEDINSGDSRNSDEVGRTDEIVAKACGLGGKDTYRKAKRIFESGDIRIINLVDTDEISIHKASELLKKPKATKAKRPTTTEMTDTCHAGINEPESEINKLKQQLQLEKDFSNGKEMEIRNLSNELQQSKQIIKILQKVDTSNDMDVSPKVIEPEISSPGSAFDIRAHDEQQINQEELIGNTLLEPYNMPQTITWVPLPVNAIEICHSFIGIVENFHYQLKQNISDVEIGSEIMECINDCSMMLLKTVNELKALTNNNEDILKTKSDTKTKRAVHTKARTKKKLKGKQKTNSILQPQAKTSKKKTPNKKDEQSVQISDSLYVDKPETNVNDLALAEGV